MEEGADTGNERLLDPVDRISEVLFGLIMAVTIVGSLSVASAGRSEVRTVMIAALGCNLAWGLVDAVMYVVRTLTERSRNRVLARRIVHAEPPVGRRLLEASLPAPLRAVTGPDEIEGMRRRLLAAPPPASTGLERRDFAAAFGIFALVVLATFPVVVPFILLDDVALAMKVSQATTVGMLFLAGLALGRAGAHDRPLWTGVAAALLGVVLVAIVKALGG